MLVSEEMRKRISVIAIAPIVYISKNLCSYVMHYRSKADFFPRLFDNIKARQCADVITDLDPEYGTKWLCDHSILSPTYKKPLKDHIYSYLNDGVLY